MGRALSVEEVAEYLGLAKDTVYRKAKTGEIPGVRIGRSWRFPQDVIDEWLREKAGKGEDRDGRGGHRNGSRETRGGEIQTPSPSELKRRRRLFKRIMETRRAFQKLPSSADEAYRISRRELERRPLGWMRRK